MLKKPQSKIILALSVVILGMLIAFIVYRGRTQEKKIAAQNELARVIPFRAISESLSVKYVRISSNLSDEIAKTSQLKKTVMNQKQTILMLTSFPMEAKVESVYVALKRRPGEFAVYFDTTSEWWSLSGIVDTSSLLVTNLEARDSITVALTRSADDLLYGYVQNHSPFVTIRNADFAIDASQFISRPSSVWKYAAIGEAVLLVLKFLK